ncbi:peptidoglycan-binding protein [Acidothermaceae bacterium B102]|nr:peptidoglycan-binding protein [Acidothermaceae bacterium B102]
MVEKATLTTEGGDSIPFMFNPTDLTIAKSASWQASPAKGKDAPQLKFQGGQPGTVTLSVMLDAVTTGKSVLEAAQQLLALASIDATLGATDTQRQSARPPWVELHWGLLQAPFRAVVEKVQIKYTYFAQDGTPLRAKVDLSLKQYEDQTVLARQNPTSHTPRPHTTHRLKPGETLDRVAAIQYGDPNRWRLLAEANRIDNPLRLATGSVLVIPELPVRRRA